MIPLDDPRCPPNLIPKDAVHHNLVPIGWLPCQTQLAKDCDNTKVNPFYLRYDPILEHVPVELTHGVIQTTARTVNKQVLLFDKPDVRLPESCYIVIPQMVEMFKHFGIVSRPCDLSELEINKKGGCGFWFKHQSRQYSWKYKRSMMLDPEGLAYIKDYYDNAHIRRYIALCEVCGKCEYIKMKKIMEEDQRCFECFCAPETLYGMRLNQAFNKAMSRANLPLFSVGTSFQSGGFNHLIKKLDRGTRDVPTKGMGDVSKWDKSFMHELRDLCRRIRIECIHSAMPPRLRAEYVDRLNYYYERSIYTFLRTPLGQIFLTKYGGMKSGDASTTYDNTIAHIIVQFAFYYEETGVLDWRRFISEVGLAIYADDHLFDYGAHENLADFQKRKAFYERCGFQLKVEDDRTSTSWEGMTYLGATVGVSSFGTYVPIYCLRRIWSSICRSKKGLTAVEEFLKTRSLLVLSVFNGAQAYAEIEKYLREHTRLEEETNGYGWFLDEQQLKKLREQNYLFLAGDGVSSPYIPSYEWSVGFWHGWERSLRDVELTIDETLPIGERRDTPQRLDSLYTFPKKINQCSVPCHMSTRIIDVALPQRVQKRRNRAKVVEEVVVVPTSQGKPKRKRKSKAQRARLQLQQRQAPIYSEPVRRLMNANRVSNSVKQKALSTQPTGSVNSEYAAIVVAMTSPKDNPAVRWTSMYSSMPTAVAAPWSITTAPWAASATPTQTVLQLTYDTMLAFLFRCAERALVIYDANTSALTQTYLMYGVGYSDDTAAVAPNPVFQMGTNQIVNNIVPLKIPFMLATSTYAPHGPQVFAGAAPRDEMRRFFWLEGNNSNKSQLSGTITQSPAGSYSVTVLFDYWDDEGLILGKVSSPVTQASQTFTLNIPTSGYWAISVQVIASTGTLTMNNLTYTCSTSTFRHLCMPHYDLNVLSADGMRVISGSLMYTNEAAPLNAQGKIVGVQLPVESAWTDYIRATAVTELMTTAQAKTLTADKGIYGFLKPTMPADFNITTHVQVLDGVLVDSFYPIAHDSAFLAMGVSIQNAIGQDGYFTAAYGIEYQTTDVWRETKVSPCAEWVYNQALVSLRAMPQWHENPLHFDDIVNFIKKATKATVGAIQKYGPTVIKSAEMFAPLLL